MIQSLLKRIVDNSKVSSLTWAVVDCTIPPQHPCHNIVGEGGSV